MLVRSTESIEELSDQKTEQMGEPENQMGVKIDLVTTNKMAYIKRTDNTKCG